MKCSIFIDKNGKEEVHIFARERTLLVEKIEQLVKQEGISLVGKKDRCLYNIELSDVVCFLSENNKVFAMLKRERYEIDEKLYELEDSLPESFVKINKSCIANVEMIASFDATFAASLAVNFKNGYRDYVSRRRVKYVKERVLKK